MDYEAATRAMAAAEQADVKRFIMVSYANVAEVIAQVIQNHAAVRQTVNFYDGVGAIADVVKG